MSMKYLLSILLFLGFIFFSIPCFADVTDGDPSTNSQDVVTEIINRATIPEVVREEASNQASLIKKAQVGVAQDFVEDVTNFTCNLFSSVLSVFGIKSVCLTDVSVGKDIAHGAASAKILGQSGYPAGIELIPANNDPNLIDFTATNSASVAGSVTGNEKLNDLSENLGTTTGFYRSNEAPLSDYDDYVKQRLEEEEGKYNLNLNGKPFIKDERSPDMYSSKQVFCMGNYPKVDGKAICPFEPPTP